MSLQQQCRFCGVVSKRKEKHLPNVHSLLKFSRLIQQEIIFFSSLELTSDSLFDGFLLNRKESHFDPDLIDSYSGNWSSATFSNQNLVLSRDRLGVRSMYYFENDDFFCFANEIKLLLEIEFIPFVVSSSAVFRFLVEGENEILGDNLFKDINELPPSHNLSLDLTSNTVQIERYYQFVPKASSSIQDIESSSKIIKEKLSEVTKVIFGQGGNLGSLLSGGIDSSAIAASIFLNGHHNDVSFLTAMTNDRNFDELPFAESVIRQFGIMNWHQVLVKNFSAEVEKMHFAMELPTLSAGSFLQYELFRFAKHFGLNYVIDGTGADSLYAGHYYHKAIYWNGLIRKREFKKLGKEIGYYRGHGNWLKYYFRNLLKYSYLPKMPPSIKMKAALKINPLLSDLNPDFVNANKNFLNTEKPAGIRNLNDFLTTQFFDGGVRKLLRFLDRFGKHFEVPNLSVFSENPSIFEHALNIDPDLKIKNGQFKYVLRYAFKDELPIEVLERNDKKGLVAPNNQWIKENKALFLAYFDQDLSEYFQMDAIRASISEMIDDLGDVENYKLFKFISFAIWYKVFSEKYSN